MKRVSVTVVFLLAFSSIAMARQPSAMVRNRGRHVWLSSNVAPCTMALEHKLRELNYKVLENTLPEEDADLVLWVSARCPGAYSKRQQQRRRFDMHRKVRKGPSECRLYIVGKWRHIRGRDIVIRNTGTGKMGFEGALSSACADAAETLGRKLGGRAKKVKGSSRSSDTATARKYVLAFSWKGELKPLPLLKLTYFFNKMGFKTKLLKGGQHQSKYQIELAQKPEEFRMLLDTFLKTHYRFKYKGVKARMNYKLESK